ncbi:alpha/beta hydrolase family protein [Maricaulaceae bacterium MS644]
MPVIRFAIRSAGVAMVSALAVLTACAPPPVEDAPQAGAERFDGSWHGVLDLGAQTLTLELELETEGEAGPQGALISIDQGGVRMALTALTIEGDRIAFEADPPGFSYEGELESGAITGRFQQNAGAVDLMFERGPAEAGGTPAEASLSDNERAVVIESGPVRLAGVLRTPSGAAAAGPVPGVVILSGSGPQDRDGMIAGQPVYAALADGLARAGIASLRLDDRGVGMSTGPVPRAPSDLASDAAAALASLRSEPEIRCAGFAGHSEGAMLALLAAPEARPAFIVSLAGMHLSMEETLLGQSEAIIRASGGTDAQIAANRELQEAMFEVFQTLEAGGDLAAALETALIDAGAPAAVAAQQAAIWGQPYVAASFRLDPGAEAAAYGGPLLALFAENDTQVLAGANSAALETARAGKPTEIRVLAGVNHLFQVSATGAPSEYGSASHAMAPEALQVIGDAVSALAGRACGDAGE